LQGGKPEQPDQEGEPKLRTAETDHSAQHAHRAPVTKARGAAARAGAWANASDASTHAPYDMADAASLIAGRGLPAIGISELPWYCSNDRPESRPGRASRPATCPDVGRGITRARPNVTRALSYPREAGFEP
jgi:hypothetical protein